MIGYFEGIDSERGIAWRLKAVFIQVHIRDAIGDVREYVAPGREAFMTDRLRQDAVLRKLEIIGEAVKRPSDETRQRRSEIPWKQIAGLRDRLVHDYFGVDLALVWVVVDRDLKALSEAVEALLASS